MEAMRNTVSASTGVFVRVSCTPSARTYSSFPSRTTPNTRPGTWFSVMKSSNTGSSACRAGGPAGSAAAASAPLTLTSASRDNVKVLERMPDLSARNRWGRTLEHGLDRETGLNARDARDTREHVEHEALIARQVRHDDAQHVVRLAGHEVAAHHLGHVRDAALEHLECFLDL